MGGTRSLLEMAGKVLEKLKSKVEEKGLKVVDH